MQFPYHVLIGLAAKIPISDPVPVSSISPIVLECPDRPVDLQVRVTYPTTLTSSSTQSHPVVIISHGRGESNYLSSLDGYAPLAEFYASHGFVVLLPTLLGSSYLGLNDSTGHELFWDQRPKDISRVIDKLEAIESAIPSLHGRLDTDKIVAVGHSFGGQGTSFLLGATNTDPRTNVTTDLKDERIKAGIIIAGTGNGGKDLSEDGAKLNPAYGPDFSSMKAPALVVYGDEDVSPHLTVRDADWHADPYKLSPEGNKSLFTVRGGKHHLGGVSGWDAAEAKDESPERLAAVQRLTWAWLWSQVYEGDKAWEEAVKGLDESIGTVESK